MRNRKINNDPCVECSNPKVLCKGLCQACYSKKKRNTPEGKARMKLYNEIKGKEAAKKYREKKRPKTPKLPKQICECGALSAVRGFCHKCYHKYYQRRIFKRKARATTSQLNNNFFGEVINHVRSGLTISAACEVLNIDKSKLYRQMTDIQKKELLVCKLLGVSNQDED